LISFYFQYYGNYLNDENSKIKDNPPSLPPSLAFRQSKKAMVDEESKKTKEKPAR
jgi:hypothetical protein